MTNDIRALIPADMISGDRPESKTGYPNSKEGVARAKVVYGDEVKPEMVLIWQRQSEKLNLVISLTLGGLVVSIGDSVRAQIVPDKTLGAESSVVTPNVNINSIPSDMIDGGAIRGTNLFHSFQEFNVGEASGAYFKNPAGIENILTRVTGGNPSKILGRLGVLGNANLFLINPNGIVFGENARLDLHGSFLATTANAVVFDSGSLVSATNPEAPPLLAVNIPIGLQFRSQAGNIQVQGAELQVPNGETLALVGGNVSLDGGILQAPGGRVELGGMSGRVTLGLTSDLGLLPPDFGRIADVSLNNKARVSVIDSNGGSISVNARNIYVSGESRMVAGIETKLGSQGSGAGDITLNATGAIALGQSSAIGNQVGFEAIGSGGDINIVAGSLSMTDGAQVSAISYGDGNAGFISLRVNKTLTLAGVNTGIFSNVNFEGIGNSGGIDIQGGSLSMIGGAQLQSTTSGQGNAGSVRVRALDLVSLTGADTAIFSNNNASISINARKVSMTDGAQLISSTFGERDAGVVSLQATDTVSLSGKNTSILSNVLFISNSGGIEIDTGSLAMNGGAQLMSSTAGGNAGPVRVRASDEVSLAGAGTAIFSRVEEGASGGNSSGIDINARSVSMTDGAQLIAATFGVGNAGAVSVQTQDAVALSGANTVIFSSVGPVTIFEESAPKATAVGNSGGIAVRGRSLSLSDGAQITASTFDFQQGNAGSINIEVSDSISLVGNAVRQNPTPTFATAPVDPTEAFILVGDRTATGEDFGGIGGGEGLPGTSVLPPPTSVLGQSGAGAGTGIFSTVETGAMGNAGDIYIQAPRLSVTGGAQVQSLTRGEGNSGNIRIRVTEALLDGVSPVGDFSGFASTVESTAIGKAGDIDIESNSLSVTGGANIQALTRGQGDSGNIRLQVDSAVTIAGGGVFTSTEREALGRGGELRVTTGELRISDGAVLSARSDSAFPGGAIAVDVNSLELTRGGNIITSASFAGDAGSIGIQAGDRVTLNGSFLAAETAAGSRGNIKVRSPLLWLRNNSAITTSASGTATGGNITLETDFLVAKGNSDIIANAQQAAGGQVIINTQGIFGTQARALRNTATSDITASSDLGPQFSGTVEITTPDVDPSQGLVELPENLVDPAALIAQNPCVEGEESKFTITGRGGLPSNPNDALASDSVRVGLVDPAPAVGRGERVSIGSRGASEHREHRSSFQSAIPNSIVPARGWIFNDLGEVVLTAYNPTDTETNRQGRSHGSCADDRL